MRNRASGVTRPSITVPLPRRGTVLVILMIVVIIISGFAGYMLGLNLAEPTVPDNGNGSLPDEPTEMEEFYYDQLKNYWTYLYPYDDTDVVTITGTSTPNNVYMYIEHTVPYTANGGATYKFRFEMQTNGLIVEVKPWD